MPHYEYKVIAAPTKGVKTPGVKTAEGRFAKAIETLMNELAAEGWSYLRSDLLPSEERQGLTSSQTVYRSLLIFRRALSADVHVTAQPMPAAAPEPTPPITSPAVVDEPQSPEEAPATPQIRPLNDVPDDPLKPR